MNMDTTPTVNMDTAVNEAEVPVVTSPAGHTEDAAYQTDPVSITSPNSTLLKTKTSVATANTSGDRHPVVDQTHLKVANSGGNSRVTYALKGTSAVNGVNNESHVDDCAPPVGIIFECTLPAEELTDMLGTCETQPTK
ncbi:hypothetical protein CRM22_005295 [Opisthorchis felineus]|uniref:Uncharacterized protein n=1 Tax=Opisthorchis felineus TaxID=147828 RepID=A0A4S2LYJ1_OPIFE|nr:hypothetical protein CRM22_005295 [Opisthorchis felineus]